ncbi:tRNA-dihydrouridine(20a/20b) synthase [NAD(P)+]-like isoform X1 [Anopheles stephensi]|uniref:tRNA-dihydrouridine(20a/20b) synthase [NAD(P)+]-like isoform X1 n=1 Tax=Anopheles stephensi TaxID=30069 RepID=UPI001658BACB|nr:tRNA-dihydrouridine(20a/20b) synthase [NAD(P)+]-like isoform X1 [Anopheles stephensi]
MKEKTNIRELFSSAAERNTYLKICAPMVRYSKLEFRSLVRTYGTDLAFTSMIMADSFCKSEKARLNEFTTHKDDTPLVAQFAANNTIDFLSASEMVFPYVDGVDLNCGCPQRWAMAEGYGSALLNTPELIADMLGTVRRNMPSSFSVSVKVRLLSSTNQKRTIDMCRQLEATGITFLTVHGRTAPEMTKVPVHREALQEIKQSIAIPMVANGDIFTLDDAEQMYSQTKCDGIMAARGILSNPALFSGHKSTPVECVKRWLNICQQADTDITYQCMHHHFSFMTESLLTKRLRLELNNLSKEKQNVFEFIRAHLPIDSVVDDVSLQDYPEKLSCSYNDQIYRQRAAEQGAKNGSTVADGCAYDPEASDGNFFRSKRAELDDDVAEDVDGVAFMDGGSLLFDE